MLDGLAFVEELVGSLLDSSDGDLVVKLESLDRLIVAWRGGAREREHDALRDVVKLAVRLEGDGLPLRAAQSPVAHVVDGSVGS